MKTTFLTLIGVLLITASAIAQHDKSEIKKEKFNLDKKVENEVGFYQGVKVGNTIYVSGSVGWGPMDEALQHSYNKIEKTLKHYGATFQNVVKETLYTTALDSVIAHKDVRRKYYGTDYPAATWVEIRRLYTPDFVVEIEVIAILPEK